MARLWLVNGCMRGQAAGGTNTARTGKPGRTPTPHHGDQPAGSGQGGHPGSQRQAGRPIALLDLSGCLWAWESCNPKMAWQWHVSAPGGSLGPCRHAVFTPEGRRGSCRHGATGHQWTRAVSTGTAGRQDSHPMREKAPADGGELPATCLGGQGPFRPEREPVGPQPRRDKQRLGLKLRMLRRIMTTGWQQRASYQMLQSQKGTCWKGRCLLAAPKSRKGPQLRLSEETDTLQRGQDATPPGLGF